MDGGSDFVLFFHINTGLIQEPLYSWFSDHGTFRVDVEQKHCIIFESNTRLSEEQKPH